MDTITFEDIKKSTHHSVDPIGMIFFWNNKVFRAISSEATPFYKKLIESAFFSELVEKGLIETTIASLKLKDYGMIVEHRKIPVVSYPTEWSGEMLRSAALLTLELNKELATHGLELKDAHPWNILFEGAIPKFIDFGSIQKIENQNNWKAIKEFVGMFLNPLRLMGAGYPSEARAHYIDKKTNKGKRVSKQDMANTYLAKKEIVKAAKVMVTSEAYLKMPRIEAIDFLHKLISDITIPLPKTTWSDYCHEEINEETKKEWMQKRRTVDEIIAKIRPETLLDIGSNTGWFSKLASTYGSRVTAFDLDEPSVNRLFLNKEARSYGILPLVMNFTNPTPAYGIELRCEAATDRYKCDMVLGLAIVHHLCFTHKMSFEDIIGKLAKFSNKYLVIEFIPKDDIHVAKWIKSGYDWYTTENFKKELNRHFTTIEELPSNPAPRSIFLCKK
jgi:hypothetical protein